MRRVLIGVIAVLALTLTGAPAVGAATGAAHPSGRTVQVGGDVTAPATLTAAQIAAFPSTTLPLATPGGTHGTVAGALLTEVLGSAGPRFGLGKNPQLHAVVAVTGQSGRRINLAYGELDPRFGKHPALLTVTSVTLTSLTTPVTTPPAGAVTVVRGGRTVTLSAAILARLPQQQRSVTFLAGPTPQTHTEQGPALTTV